MATRSRARRLLVAGGCKGRASSDQDGERANKKASRRAGHEDEKQQNKKDICNHKAFIPQVKPVHNNFYSARKLAVAVLEGENPKSFLSRHTNDFLARHNLQRTRQLHVKPDVSNPGYFNIPVPGHGGRYVNVFKAPENPKPKIKARLALLVQTRRGYEPGDIFVTPWGRFLVTDVMGLKEV